MTLSLNEVEAQAKKAARGAGYDWGLAEEAARATRWLCGHGLDGCAALAALLTQMDGADFPSRRLVSIDGPWRGQSGMLCPVMAGASMTDFAADVTRQPNSAVDVLQPVMLVPFVASAAHATAADLSIEWGRVRFSIIGRKVSWSGDQTDIFSTYIENVYFGPGTPCAEGLERTSRAAPDPQTWQRLGGFAHRTYAPATDQSRESGAGAGLKDTD